MCFKEFESHNRGFLKHIFENNILDFKEYFSMDPESYEGVILKNFLRCLRAVILSIFKNLTSHNHGILKVYFQAV